MRNLCVAVTVLTCVLGLCPASAQLDIPPNLVNQPPIPAPTEKVEVAPVPVLRSMSEVIGDYGSGLLQGLMAGAPIRSAALVAVQDDRIIVTKTFGCCVASDLRFMDGFYSDLFAVIAALRQVEYGTLKLDDTVSNVLGRPVAGNPTVAQVLSHQADPSLLRPLVEKSSGEDFRSYVSNAVLLPPLVEGNQMEKLPRTMGRLLVALLNGGVFEGERVAAHLDLMQQPQYSIHPALPGWTDGFVELRRNGWRALQYDGVWLGEPAAEARIVLAPDASIAYFIIVEGHAGREFWRTLDDNLFDRIFEPREGDPPDVPESAPPDAHQAQAAAGLYELSDEPLASVAPLKLQGRRLLVEARDDGGLVLSGVENAVLIPRAGGFWSTDDRNLNAAMDRGRLILGSGIYAHVPYWKRPELYASFALLLAFGTAGAAYRNRRNKRAARLPSTLVLALAGGVSTLILAAILIWLSSPPV